MVRTVVLAILLTTLAGVVGGWAGVQYGLTHVRPSSQIDEILHHQLTLTPEQKNRIATLETRFSGYRKDLNAEMRAANRDLAIALNTTHAYGPEAKRAIERFYNAMGALQEKTVIHILEMRAVLTPQQSKRFDSMVLEAFSSDQL